MIRKLHIKHNVIRNICNVSVLFTALYAVQLAGLNHRNWFERRDYRTALRNEMDGVEREGRGEGNGHMRTRVE